MPAVLCSLKPSYGNNLSVHWQMNDKENTVNTYNETRSSLLKEGNSVICDNMDGPCGHYSLKQASLWPALGSQSVLLGPASL